MKKILAFTLLFLPVLANAQCPKSLSLTQLQTIFKADDKEDILLRWGFDKTSDNNQSLGFGRCRKNLLKKDYYYCTNLNESILIFGHGGFIYSTYDRNHYLNIKAFVKSHYKSMGKDEVKGDLYTKNSISYGFKVNVAATECGNVNNFQIWLSRAQ